MLTPKNHTEYTAEEKAKIIYFRRLFADSSKCFLARPRTLELTEDEILSYVGLDHLYVEGVINFENFAGILLYRKKSTLNDKCCLVISNIKQKLEKVFNYNNTKHSEQMNGSDYIEGEFEEINHEK